MPVIFNQTTLRNMESKTNKNAILVDGDNAQPKLLKPILEEVSKYGKVTIRRIYGDWTKPQMSRCTGQVSQTAL